MASKKSSDVATVNGATPTPFRYVDADGIEQAIDLSKVKNLGETKFAESKRLFPNAKPCMISKSGIGYDDQGRPNILNDNLAVVGAVHMTKGDFGPWFLVQAHHAEYGEISFPAPGISGNEAVEYMSGIALTDKYDADKKLLAKAGDRFQAAELPVFCRFEFVPNAGKYGEGYFIISPAVEQIESVE